MRHCWLVLSILFLQSIVIVGQKPFSTLKTSGGVIDMVVQQDMLYAATDNGTVDVFNWKKKSLVKIIHVPDILDFMGDKIPAKVHSVDVGLNGTVLLVCQGKSGFRDMYIYDNNNLQKVLDAETNRMMIKKARFMENSKVLLGLLSNELILYDLETKTKIYTKQVSTSTFSDFQLNEDRTKAVVADESGILRMIDPETGSELQELMGENLDNVYQVDIKNNVVIGAGQDRRVSVYFLSNGQSESFHLQRDFLIYSAGLSPSGAVGACLSNDDNHLLLFDTSTKQTIAELKGHHSTVTKIVFLSEMELISSSDDPEILIWKVSAN